MERLGSGNARAGRADGVEMNIGGKGYAFKSHFELRDSDYNRSDIQC